MFNINAEIMSIPNILFQSSNFNKLVENRTYDNTYESPIYKALIHPKNVRFLQNQIISKVWYDSDKKYKISPQNKKDLLKIVKSVYDTYGDSNNISKSHILQLDKMIVNRIANDISTNLESNERFMNKLYGPNVVLDYPMNTSKFGSKILPTNI